MYFYTLLNTNIYVSVDESVTGAKPSRRSLLRKKMEHKVIEPERVQKVEETITPENKDTVPENKEAVTEKSGEKVGPVESPPQANANSTQPLLMVEVVNITHEKFRQTEEIKVIFLYLVNKCNLFMNNIFIV